MNLLEHTAPMQAEGASKRQSYPVRGQMLPLSMAKQGEQMVVRGIRGKDDVRRFLESLGFVEGAEVMVISELSGNVIVTVKGTRVAVSKAMASRVLTG